MKTYLKIKICSLAAEAALIKREERRWKSVKNDHPLAMNLRLHRIHEVRTECRSAIIAYGYLRGRSYHKIEPKCHESPNWARVADLIRKYGPSKYINTAGRKQLAEDLKTWSSIAVKKAA